MPPGLANFCILVEMGFRHVSQAGLQLLTLGDSPTLASQSAGIAGVSHRAQPDFFQVFKNIKPINILGQLMGYIKTGGGISMSPV